MAFQPNTVIKLISIPEFQIDNGSQIWFDTPSEQESYFSTKTVYTFDDATYVRVYDGSIKININAEILLAKCPNWMMFRNTNYGNKWFYANILNVTYLNPDTTQVNYNIDNFQTYMFQLKLNKPSYIQRRHWCFEENHSDIMNLPLEDLDIGSNYLYCDQKYEYNKSMNDYENDQWYYLLTTKALGKDGAESFPTNDITTGEITITTLDGSTGTVVEKTSTTSNGINTQLNGYIFNFKALNEALNSGYFTSCARNGSLQQITLLPFGRDMFRTDLVNIASEVGINTGEVYDQQKFGGLQKEVEISHWCDFLNDYINRCLSDNFNTQDGKVYNQLPESAIGLYLYRAPYTNLVQFDYSNQPLTIDLSTLNYLQQYSPMSTNKLKVLKYASVGPTSVLCHTLKGYKKTGYRSEQRDIDTLGNMINMGSDNLETVQSQTSIPVISDYTSAFLQANANQITAQKANLRDTYSTTINNAGVAQQAQAEAIKLNYNTSTSSARIANENAKISANTQYKMAVVDSDAIMSQAYIGMAQNGAQAISGAFQGASMGAMAGSPIGAVGGGLAGAAGGLISMGANYASAQVSSNRVMQQAGLSQNASMSIAQNNLKANMIGANNSMKASMGIIQASYASTLRTAQTAYQNEIRSIQARLQDINNVPDSIQVQGSSGSYFNTLMNRDMISYTTKAILREPMQRIIDYFTRYGFITSRNEKISDILTRFKPKAGVFIQTVNANISGEIPYDALSEIKKVFDAGVMIWNKNHYLDYEAMRRV